MKEWLDLARFRLKFSVEKDLRSENVQRVVNNIVSVTKEAEVLILDF